MPIFFFTPIWNVFISYGIEYLLFTWGWAWVWFIALGTTLFVIYRIASIADDKGYL